MPAYQIDLHGKQYRVDAADEAELQATVSQLEREHAERGEEERLSKGIDESERTRGWFADVGASAIRGPLKALDAAAGILSFIPEDAGLYYGEDGFSFTKGENKDIGDAIDALGPAQTTSGALVEGVTQFVVGSVPVARVLKGAQLLQQAGRATTALRGLTVGAATSAVFFDGQEANLANLVQAVPALQNPVTDFMANDEDTPEAVGRLKNAVMDAVGGVAVEGVVGMIRAGKQAMRSKTNVLTDANSEVVDAAPAKAPEAAPAATTAEGVTPATGAADVAGPAPATTADALAAKERPYSELPEDEAVDRLSRRLGITGEKLGKIREALQRGVPGEDVEKILDLNPKHIDWSNIRSADDVVALMNTVTRTLGVDVAGRAGYAPQTVEWVTEQAAKLADEVGGGYKDAVGMLERVRDLPAVVVLQRKLVTASATHLRDLAEKIRKGTNNPSELLEFVAHERRHALLQVTVRGTRAQVGRALRMMQEGVKVSEDSLKLANAKAARAARQEADKLGKPVEVPAGRKVTADEAEKALKEAGLDSEKVRNLADTIAKIKDLEGVNRAARSGLYENFRDHALTVYINNLLSGLPTLTVNVMSGVVKMLANVVEGYGAGVFASARKGDLWELVAAHKGQMAALSGMKTGLQMAKKAAIEGMPQTDLYARHEVLAHGGKAEGVVMNALTLPSRAIITIDEFFKQVFYQQELTTRSVEVAAAAARLVKGKAAQQAEFNRVLKETLQAPPDDLMLDAIDKARYHTFQNNPGEGTGDKFVRSLIHFTNSNPSLRLFLPFIKTPYNIIKQGIEYTPMGALQRDARAALMGHRGARAQGEQVMKMTMGLALSAEVFNLVDAGTITGSKAGGRQNKNTADMAAPPYSVKIGDTWVQYNRFEPFGTVLGITADLRTYMNERGERLSNTNPGDDPEANELAAMMLTILGENVADKTFFKGITDFVELAQGIVSGELDRVQYTAQNIATNFYPMASLVRNTARVTDEVMREAVTLRDRLMAMTPGLSDKLPARRDYLGREMHHAERLGPDYISPVMIAKDDPDPVARAVASIGMSYQMPERTVAGMRLNAEQYARTTQVRGEVIRQWVERAMQNGRWDQMTRYQKQDYVKKAQTKGSKIARQTLEREDDKFRESVRNDKATKQALKAGLIE